jgi:hypothetical protein
MPSLKQVCIPRASVFDSNKRDTVHDILDLVKDNIDAKEFFTENFVTQGMRTFLTEAFKRLEGESAGAQAIFRLSQSMGGGKTHNLIAFGLLCRHPELRDQVMGKFHTVGNLGKVQVVAFSGRATDAPHGIWGDIAKQLGKQEQFAHYMTHLEAPGQEAWTQLLQGDPLAIILDELPTYMEYAHAKRIGDSNLAVVTTAALSNLFVAVADNKLDNVVLAISDLSGASYEQGQTKIDQIFAKVDSLRNLNQEAIRLSMPIDPVRMNSDELYQILRTRLFEKLPAEATVKEVARGYADAIRKAKVQDITTASPEQFAADVESAYPFHPAIRDLYARFKENQGFQQTRALIRIMRIIVADLWSSGRADSLELVGAHNINLADAEMVSEVKQINAKLDGAIAHDISSQGSASAEAIDKELGGTDAQDVAKLVFLASLADGPDQVLGLNRGEIVQYLAAPGRDVAKVNKDAIDQLQTRAWYLHVNRDGRLYFKDIQNINAKLSSYIGGMQRESKEKELRKQLEAIFSPAKRDCYQKLLCLPAIDEVDLTQEQVTLVIFQPREDSLQSIKQFHEQTRWRNRVCFITGDGKTFDRVIDAAAGLKAVDLIIKEMVDEGRPASDPQLQEAEEIKTKLVAKLYMAVKSTFATLYYPTNLGLTKREMDFQYSNNKFVAEEQVIQTLQSAYKYTTDVGPDGSFRAKVESKLWREDGQPMSWTTIKEKAAINPAWEWHVPNALENLKSILVQRDAWRETSGYVDRGPFPQPKTEVRIQQVFRDADTGEATLRVTALHGDHVYMEIGGPATPGSKKLDSNDYKTREMELHFVAVDSTKVHETGEQFIWKNTVTLKHRFFQDGEVMRCEVRAAPAGQIKFTTDGSNPTQNGGSYTEPFVVPSGSKFVQAIAVNGAVTSDVLRVSVPAEPEKLVIDPQKGYDWDRKFDRDSTMEAYEFLALCRKHDIGMRGVQANADVAASHRFAEFLFDAKFPYLADQVQSVLDLLQSLLPDSKLSLRVSSLNFASGQDLLDVVADLKMQLPPVGEVNEVIPK